MGAVEEASIESVLSEAGVRFAYLFGSRVAGGAGPASDADIAVMPSRPSALLERERLAARLARVLDVPDVDLVFLDEAGLELRGHIIQTGRLIYSADEPARVAFEVRTRSEYFDFLPSLKALERAYLDRVAERGL